MYQLHSDSIFRHITDYLNDFAAKLAVERNLPSVHHLTQEFHVWPDFHGNRSPIADPNIKGMICGLTMSPTEENLAISYLAFVQAIAVSSNSLLNFVPIKTNPFGSFQLYSVRHPAHTRFIE